MNSKLKYGLFSSLLLVLLINPAYGDVTSLTFDKPTYTLSDKITVLGTEDIGRDMITVIIRDPSDAKVMLRSAISDSEGNFKLVPIDAKDIFSSEGTYSFNGFANEVRQLVMELRFF